MVVSFCNFAAKLELDFVLTFENAFFKKLHFKSGTRDFQNSPSFERSACFLCDKE